MFYTDRNHYRSLYIFNTNQYKNKIRHIVVLWWSCSLAEETCVSRLIMISLTLFQPGQAGWLWCRLRRCENMKLWKMYFPQMNFGYTHKNKIRQRKKKKMHGILRSCIKKILQPPLKSKIELDNIDNMRKCAKFAHVHILVHFC